MLYLGWILAAFLSGVLITLWLLFCKNRQTLRDGFSQVESFRGRSYCDILAMAGQVPDTVLNQKDGGTLKTWREKGYSITLSFDARDVCRGVVDEKTSESR